MIVPPPADDVAGYELTLFVSGASERSARAIASTRELCDCTCEGGYRPHGRRRARRSRRRDHARVIVTPTLVKNRRRPCAGSSATCRTSTGCCGCSGSLQRRAPASPVPRDVVQTLRPQRRPADEVASMRVATTQRMAEAEDTLRAIGAGEVDAFVVSGDDGDRQRRQVFTLVDADRPYRLFVENMPRRRSDGLRRRAHPVREPAAVPAARVAARDDRGIVAGLARGGRRAAGPAARRRPGLPRHRRARGRRQRRPGRPRAGGQPPRCRSRATA